MNIGLTSLHFRYDFNNVLIGCFDGSQEYYYVRDSLGIIHGIINRLGNYVVKYSYNVYGVPTISIQSGYESNIVALNNPFLYKGYYYDDETGLYYCNCRYYYPLIGRWISPDNISYLEPNSLLGINLYAYCNNNPIMYVDEEGRFPVLAVILGTVALVGLGLTIGGVAENNNILTAVGLGLIGSAAIISGGIAGIAAIGSGAILSGIIGGGTLLAGAGSLAFMTAEIQDALDAGNWIKDITGISDELYDEYLLGIAFLATAGTIASSVANAFQIKSIQNIQKYGNYYGMRFTTGSNKIRVLSFHTHSHTFKGVMGWHWQLMKYSLKTGKTAGTIARWLWLCLMRPW